MTQEPDRSNGVIWTGHQWQVSDRGLDELPADEPQRYWIEVAGLGDPHLLGHMAGKRWVDFGEFTTAFLIACVAHGVRIPDIGERLAKALKQIESRPNPV